MEPDAGIQGRLAGPNQSAHCFFWFRCVSRFSSKHLLPSRLSGKQESGTGLEHVPRLHLADG